MKLTFNIDSTSLGHSACILEFIRTTIGEVNAPEKGAYRDKKLSVNIVYGIAVHAYIDTMYRSNGHHPTARKKAEKLFLGIPFHEDKKKLWMNSFDHVMQTCYQVWYEHIDAGRESNFQLLQIPQKCFWCVDGRVKLDNKENNPSETTVETSCKKCNGTGIVVGPATEINFKIPYYEDSYIKVYLCGTIDRLGKFTGGCYSIRDWKTTGSWKQDEYFVQYELSRQLRFYNLACRIMGEHYPESEIGKLGVTQIGACIDGIFLSENGSETQVISSEVFQYKREDIDAFQKTLDDFIMKLSKHVQFNFFPKEGILNGSCNKQYGQKCSFWVSCKVGEELSREVILPRDFVRKEYNPLAFNT